MQQSPSLKCLQKIQKVVTLLFLYQMKKYGIVPAEIMPETFQSSNTEEMNNCLNYYLRKISAEIRKVALEGQNIENIVEIKEL